MNADPFSIIFTTNFETSSSNEITLSFNPSYSLTPTYQDTSSTSVERPQPHISSIVRPPGRKPNIIKNREKRLPFLIDCHDNKKEDNMIKKIKPHYHRFLLKFINNCIKRIGRKTYLKKLEGKYNSDTSIDNNRILLETPIALVLSTDISKRFKNFERSYNKNVISSLMKTNVYIKGLLELTYEYIYMNVFIKKENEDRFDNMYVEYFKNCIPDECCFDKLVDKQESSLKETLNVFGKEKFVWKIVNGVSRSRKINMNY